jgi:hypothetical protein
MQLLQWILTGLGALFLFYIFLFSLIARAWNA